LVSQETGSQAHETQLPEAQPVVRYVAHSPPPVMPSSLALAADWEQELPARSQAISPAWMLAPQPPSPAVLPPDSRLHRPLAALCRRSLVGFAAAELARLLKVWEASRPPATVPGLGWPSAMRVA
jgi:hypothetical protein